MNTTAIRPRWQVPRLDPSSRWIGGVAAAIAREIGVQPIVIRVAFTLSLVVGWGLLAYVLAWIALSLFGTSQLSPYSPDLKGATSLHRHGAVAMITIGFIVLFAQQLPSSVTNITWPIGFVFAGALIAWSRGNETEGISVVVRIVAGLTLTIGGVLAFAALSELSLSTFLISFSIGLAVVAGVTLIAAPSVVRMARSLDSERMNSIRSDERARISAHLHDSVLQTLTLIQRNADDPARTAQLARQQERELRNWLYGQPETDPAGVRLGPALEQAASEVEDTHGVLIDVVAVGDTGGRVDGDLVSLIAATKEAMTNAAKHSGVNRIDVFVERTADAIEIFVRDTGVGFDLDEVSADRHGVADSIVARMERAHGSAHIYSAAGEGTEVELRLPLDVLPPDAESNETETS